MPQVGAGHVGTPGAQGPDHPVHPAIPETRYIKSLTCRLLPNS